MDLSDFTSYPDFPVRDVLHRLNNCLVQNPNLVLIAPPGAGKTTLVPLALLKCGWRQGRKIIVLEPRRLAARAAAQRMAHLLGEKVGKRVGYRMRLDSRTSSETVIEVVTEGVFSRILANDPGLEAIAVVVFDEFHERSLDGDVALALCLDLQSGLREDLRLIAMSATLDGALVAGIMGAETIKSTGQNHPVEVTYQEKATGVLLEDAVVKAVCRELAQNRDGGILVFLPGQREIEQVFQKLDGKTPKDVSVHRLYGALAAQQQDAALQPTAPGYRKVILSSAIAETSLTIDGVTCVIDSGLSRQAVFEPATGLTHLQTVRSSKASVTQRAGRAGRLGPGRAVRLWRATQTAALPPFTPPEILNSDLSSLVLDLANWGVSGADQLKWIDPPPKGALDEAAALLTRLGALDQSGRITAHGRDVRNIPMPPGMAHMVVVAGGYCREAATKAALLALLVQERGVGGRAVDLAERYTNTMQASDQRCRKLVQMAKSIAGKLDRTTVFDTLGCGGVARLCLSRPDRTKSGPYTTGYCAVSPCQRQGS